MINQLGRIYELEVGDSNQGFTIRDLHITFDINKMSDNKKGSNNCTIEIYNLSREHQIILQNQYIYAVFKVGYVETGLELVFSGQVVNCQTRKSGADSVTQIQMGGSYTELNHETVSKFIPDGNTYKDVIEDLRKSKLPKVSRAVYAGVNCQNPVVDGYPMYGTARQVLDDICSSQDIEYQIDGDTLYISDVGGSHTKDLSGVFVIGQSTGLVERPYDVSGDVRRKKKDKKKKSGIQFKCLINPKLVCGSIIKLEYGEMTGYYKISAMRIYGGYRDNDWYMDVKCEKNPTK